MALSTQGPLLVPEFGNQRSPEGCGPYDAVMGGPHVRNVRTGRLRMMAFQQPRSLWPLRLIIESWFWACGGLRSPFAALVHSFMTWVVG
jgi:hypothetical protein